MASPVPSPRGTRPLRKGVVRKRSRRRQRRLRGAGRLALGLILGLGLVALWAAPQWAWDGHVLVTGNRLVSDKQVSSRIAAPAGTPLYRLSPRAVSERITALPAVREAGVRRWLFPARLEVRVLEREALLAVAPGSGDREGRRARARWIDASGVCFEADSRLLQPAHPISLLADTVPGEQLEPALLGAVLTLVTAWPAGRGGRIDARAPEDLRITVGKMHARLGAPTDARAKLDRLKALEALAAPYGDRLDHLDLRYPESPVLKLRSGRRVPPPNGVQDPHDPPAPQLEKKAAPR